MPGDDSSIPVIRESGLSADLALHYPVYMLLLVTGFNDGHGKLSLRGML